MRPLRLSLRFIHIALVLFLAALAYAWSRLRGGRLDRDGIESLRGRRIAATMETLGATFIKLGQILSTRPDLLGPGYTTQLARLQDAVPPAPFAVVEAVIAAELSPADRARLAWIDPEPLAAASVAQVHKGRLVTGEAVALKVQRPEAASQIERDLAILGVLAALADRVPSVHLLSLPGAVARFGEALRGQLDFRLEAANNRRFAASFAAVPGVGVPRLFPDLCSRRVLGMELVLGVKATARGGFAGDAKRLARVGGEAILKMVFLDGFVHADLHPGNIILADDGRLVLLDLGLVTEIAPDLQRVWAETFIALSQGDGARAASLFYGYAPTVGTTRYADFAKDVTDFLAPLRGKSLGEVEVGEAVGGMMNVLRRHKVQVDPCFTVVHVALLVAEGLGKQLDPGHRHAHAGSPLPDGCDGLGAAGAAAQPGDAARAASGVSVRPARRGLQSGPTWLESGLALLQHLHDFSEGGIMTFAPRSLRAAGFAVSLSGAAAVLISAGCGSHAAASSGAGGEPSSSSGTGGATSTSASSTGGGASSSTGSSTSTTTSLSTTSSTSSGAPIDVCGAPSGALAWTASIPATTAGLSLVDIQAGPTDDVVVADRVGSTTFEQHRWSSAGAAVSTHQDTPGAYTGAMFTSGLFLDPQNDAFYGVLHTGPQGSGTALELVWNRITPAGAVAFSSPTMGSLPTAGGVPAVTFFQVGGDATDNLHGAFLMPSPAPIGDGVDRYLADGTNLGASGQNITGTLTPSDFLWPSQDNGLVLWRPLTATTSLGCAAALTVPAGGGVALAKFTAYATCTWDKLLALPTAAVKAQSFRLGADGSMLAAVVFAGTIDFGGGSLQSAGTDALALARFDSSGNLLWAKPFGGAGASFTLGSVGANAAGDVLLTAGYAGAVDLGGGALPATADTFLAVFTSAGALKWSKTVTVGASGGLQAAVGSCGLVVATDSPSVDLGSGPLATVTGGVASIGVAALGISGAEGGGVVLHPRVERARRAAEHLFDCGADGLGLSGPDGGQQLEQGVGHDLGHPALEQAPAGALRGDVEEEQRPADRRADLRHLLAHGEQLGAGEGVRVPLVAG